MNPSNFPSDVRPTIYQSVNLNNQERLNKYQTPYNNNNLWRDNLLAKAGYNTQNEHLPPGISPQMGKTTSFQPFHGMDLY